MNDRYTRITVPLSREEFEALRTAAQTDYRHPREQARYLLRGVLLGELLAMPETSTDAMDDDPDDDAPVEQAAPEVNQRQPMMRNKASAGVVRQVVASAGRPMTVGEIARKAQLSTAAVRTVIRRGKDFFVCAGLDEDGHTKLWMRKV